MPPKKKSSPQQQAIALIRELPVNAYLTKQYIHDVQQSKNPYEPAVMHFYAKLKGLKKLITDGWTNITPYGEISQHDNSSSSSASSSSVSSSSSSSSDSKEFGNKILNNFWTAIQNKGCNMYVLISEHVDGQCVRFVYRCDNKKIPSVNDFENWINQGVRNYPKEGQLFFDQNAFCDVAAAKSGTVIKFMVVSNTGYMGILDVTYKDKNGKFPVLKNINAE